MIRDQIRDLALLGHFSCCQIIPSGTTEGKWWLVFKRQLDVEPHYEILENNWVLAYIGGKPVRSEQEFDSVEAAERAAEEFGLPIAKGF